MNLSESVLYDRQTRLPLWDQDLIKNAWIMVCGVGGVGCEVAKNLALLGIGNLVLIDTDVVEISNLNRQLLFSAEDVGRSKAGVAAERLQSLNPRIAISAFEGRVQDLPSALFVDVDVVAGCVDNFQARMYLNNHCVLRRKPLIDASSDGFLAQVWTVLPGVTPCLSCDNPPPPDETAVIDEPCAVVGRPRTQQHCIWKALYEFEEKYDRVPHEGAAEELSEIHQCSEVYARKFGFPVPSLDQVRELVFQHIPSVISVNAVVAGFATTEILKVLFSIKRSSLRTSAKRELEGLEKERRFRIPPLSIYSSLSGTLMSVDLARDPGCLVCSAPPTIRHLELARSSRVKVLAEHAEKAGFLSGDIKTEDVLVFRGQSWLEPEAILSDVISDRDILVLSDANSKREVVIEVKLETACD